MNEQISSAGCNPLHRRDQKLRRGKRRITGKLNWAKSIVFFLLCATTAIALPAQTFTSLHSFSGPDGNEPFGLVQGTDGNFYGPTGAGGAYDEGTIFKITPAGKLTTLYSFCPETGCTDGDVPIGTLIQATDGNFYGTTRHGGNYNDGTIFKMTSAGMLTTLHIFNGTDGSQPFAGLVRATDGDFYGTTSGGGANGEGTVFKITPTGTLTTLYSFCAKAGCADGEEPIGGLIQATDGNFYGTTLLGGVSAVNGGTVFKITPEGTLTTLYSFCAKTSCTDGGAPGPFGGLVQATDGNFYGTTYGGGPAGGGTVFKITPEGALTTLWGFGNNANPEAGLIQATDGNLYGTTAFGGNIQGDVFKITPAGALKILHSFHNTDGYIPQAGLIQATSGILYGTTGLGGTNNLGTIFSLDVGLGVGPPTDKDQCKDGGWKTFTIPRKFKNQGDCVSFVNTGK